MWYGVALILLGATAYALPHARVRLRAVTDWESPLVINGNEAAKGKWPWMLSLQYKSVVGEYRHTCGATLINPTQALTSAHCTYGRRNDRLLVWALGRFRVLVGAADRGANDQEDIVSVVNVQEHKNFSWDPNGYPDDVGILTLERPVKFNKFVQPAVLADKGEEFAGAECYAIGWGKLKDTDRDVPKKLQEVKIGVLTTSDCRKHIVEGDKKNVFDQHVCIWGGSEDPKGVCHGDSGSPLNCRHTSHEAYKVVGVASWVVGSTGGLCQPEFPSVYAKVAYFRDWIDEKIKK